jgi:hypothetical protein
MRADAREEDRMARDANARKRPTETREHRELLLDADAALGEDEERSLQAGLDALIACLVDVWVSDDQRREK